MFLVCGCLMAMNSVAQQQLGQRARVQSPVVNADGTVTFNFYSPSAQRVSVSGDFDEIRNQRLEMTKQENGVWTVTTKALNPELYSYSLSVDGQRFVDPANSYVNRDISTLSNIFIVTKSDDDKGHLYSVNDVPHGTLSRVWYDSPTLGQQRRMTVYLPAAYDGKKVFPVMYLLHGHGGDETAWGDLGRASQIMDNLIAEGKCVPMIVVMPNGNPTCNAAPGWWHEGMYTPDGNAFNQRGAKASMEESFMDIVNYVDSHYKTIKKRSGRACILKRLITMVCSQQRLVCSRTMRSSTSRCPVSFPPNLSSSGLPSARKTSSSSRTTDFVSIWMNTSILMSTTRMMEGTFGATGASTSPCLPKRFSVIKPLKETSPIPIPKTNETPVIFRAPDGDDSQLCTRLTIE